MNLEVMKTFCDLVETASFSKAAEANFISQSAVSQQLAKLEKGFGVQLISRGGGLVEPTEAGKAFYTGAREILRRFEQLGGEVRSAADAVRGVLRVGTIYSVGFYLLEPYIRRFMQAHPEVNVHVDYTKWNLIYAAVISGEMDVGVVAYPQKQRSIRISRVATEELVLVCSPSHRLAGRKSVRPSDLAGLRFVGFEANIPTGRYIETMLRRHRVDVKTAMMFDSIELLKRAVEVDSGVSILPRDNVQREVEYGSLACVRFRDSQRWLRPIGAILRRGRAPTPAARTFLNMLRAKSPRKQSL